MVVAAVVVVFAAAVVPSGVLIDLAPAVSSAYWSASQDGLVALKESMELGLETKTKD